MLTNFESLEGLLAVVLLGIVACLLPVLVYLKRKQDLKFEADVQAMKLTKEQRAAGAASPEKGGAAERSAAKPEPPKQAGGPGSATRVPRPKWAAGVKRPVLKAGAKCWYEPGAGKEMVEITVAQVHEDPDGAFYTIRLPDASEKQTMRHKLDSLEERAEGIAEALLLEEELEEAKRMKSKGKGGSGREKKEERGKNSGREKKRK